MRELEPQPTPNPYLDKYHMLLQLDELFKGKSMSFKFMPTYQTFEKAQETHPDQIIMGRSYFPGEYDRLLIDATPSYQIYDGEVAQQIESEAQESLHSHGLKTYCKQLNIPVPRKVAVFFQPYISGKRAIATSRPGEVYLEYYPFIHDQEDAKDASISTSNTDVDEFLINPDFYVPDPETYPILAHTHQSMVGLFKPYPDACFQTELIVSNDQVYVVQFKMLHEASTKFYEYADDSIKQLSVYPAHRIELKHLMSGLSLTNSGSAMYKKSEFIAPDHPYVLIVSRVKMRGRGSTEMDIDYKDLKGVVIEHSAGNSAGLTSHRLFRILHMCSLRRIPVYIDTEYNSNSLYDHNTVPIWKKYLRLVNQD